VFVLTPTKYWPTAQTSRLEMAATASRSLSHVPVFRLVICTHLHDPAEAEAEDEAASRGLASTTGAGAMTSATRIDATHIPSFRATSPPQDRRIRHWLTARAQQILGPRHLNLTGPKRRFKVVQRG
jgi:hypothetical protein